MQGRFMTLITLITLQKCDGTGKYAEWYKNECIHDGDSQT